MAAPVTTVLLAVVTLLVFLPRSSGQFMESQTPQNLTIFLRDTAVFTCAAQHPSAASVSVQWFFNEAAVGMDATIMTNIGVTNTTTTLTIGNVTMMDVGTYRCQFDDSNANMQLSLSANLVIIFMPVVQITPATQTVLNGSIAELVCNTTAGTPPFLFTWLLSSTEVTVGVTSNATASTLLVDTAMMQSRSRTYTCRVTLDQPLLANRLSETGVGTLLTDFPPVVSVNDVTRVAGERIDILCRVRGDPPPASVDVAVVLRSGMVVESFLFSLEAGSPRTAVINFEIPMADPAVHAGPAVCRTRVALSSGLEEVNGSFNIAVLVPPVAAVTPLTQTVNETQQAVFTCEATAGTPPFTFAWDSGSIPATEYAIAQLSPTMSTLTIAAAFVTAHAGSYMCTVALNQTAANLQRSSSAAGSLVVQVPPVIAEFNAVTTDITLMPTLMCVIRAEPQPTVMWLDANGDEITSSDFTVVALAPMANFTYTSQLQFNRLAVLSDEMMYTCVASNAAGRAEQSAMLTVNVAPEFLEHNNVTVFTDQRAVLDCRVRGKPRPAVTQSAPASVPSSRFMTLELSSPEPLESVSSLTYSVNNVLEDAGAYACTAMNSVSVSVAMAYLTVLVPPMVTMTPLTQTVNETQQAVFTCELTAGTPPFTFAWDSGSIPSTEYAIAQLSPTMSTLTIAAASVNTHTGSYTCTVTLDREASLRRSAEATGSLVVQIPPATAEFNAVTTDITLMPTLTCVIRAEPQPTVMWLDASGAEITSSDFTVVALAPMADFTYTSQLRFNRLAVLSDEMMYTCVASNAAGGAEQSAMLTVNEAPSIVQLDDVTVVTDQMAQLACRVRAKPPAMITWTPPPGVVTAFTQATVPDASDSLFQVGTLSFTGNNVPADAGSYTCNAVNSVNSVMSTASLTVLVPPMVTVTPPTQTVNETQQAVFTCEATAGTAPFTFSWDSGSIPSTEYAVAELSPTMSTLTISAAFVNTHNGSYTCNVTLDREASLRRSAEATGTLVVQIPPVVTEFNAVTTDISLMPILTCVIRAEPQPTVMWLDANGAGIVTSSDFTVVALAAMADFTYTSQLRFNRLAVLSDEMMYTCVASNAAGRAEQSAMLTVNEAPSIVQLDNVTVVTDQMAQLICRVRAKPPAMITWTPPPGVVTAFTEAAEQDASDSMIQVGTLSFTSNNVPADAGVYTCNAVNSVNSVMGTASLTVLVPPMVTVTPPTQTVNETRQAVFTCEATAGTPPLTFAWDSGSIPATEYTVAQPSLTMSTLTIAAAFVNTHTGSYACTVTLDREASLRRSAEATGSLVVRIPPAIPEFNAVTTDISLMPTLTCVIRAEPQPTVMWFDANGAEITSSDFTVGALAPMANFAYTSQLQFNRLAVLSDEMMYTCVASNAAGRAEQSAMLTVNEAPSIMQLDDVTVVTDRMAQLACRVRAKPPAMITWTPPPGVVTAFTEATEQDASDSMVQFSTLSFTSNNVPADAGMYTCNAVNSVNSVMGTASLTVLVPPVATVSPGTLTINNNTMAEFMCATSSGTGPFSFQWGTPNGAQVASITNTASDSRLRVPLARHNQDNGTYQCTVTLDRPMDLQRSDSASAPLIIQVPTAIVEANDVTTNATQSPVLLCRTRGDPLPTVTWEGPQGNILNGPRFLQDSSTLGPLYIDHTLTISMVRPEEQGQYICQAANVAGTDDTNVFLSVQVLAVIVPANRFVIGITGMPAKLTLNLTSPGRPAVLPADITWTRADNSAFMQNDPTAGHTVSADGLCLRFSNVSTPDDGVYRVTVCNPAGCVSADIELEEQASPALLAMHANTTADEGERVVFVCSAAGLPVPNITWQLNGSTIVDSVGDYSISNVLSDTMPTINSTLTFDALFGGARGNGEYSCTATNTQQPPAVAMATLQVFTIPLVAVAPVNVSIVAENPANFTCSISAIPTPVITWYRTIDGVTTQLTNNSVDNIRIRTVSIADDNITSELTVLNVGLVDLGLYFCQGRHLEDGIMGNVTSATASLDVFVSPVVTIPPGNRTVQQFANITSFCQGTARPALQVSFLQPPEVTAASAGGTNTLPSSGMQSSDGNGLVTVNQTVELNTLLFSERGRYQCLISSRPEFFEAPVVPGVANVSASFYITVNVDARILMISDAQDVTFPNTISLQCNASGFPTPSIEWLLPGSATPITSSNATDPLGISIQETVTVETLGDPPTLLSVLTIGATQRVHNGTYTCVARTTGGPNVAQATTEVTVFEVPDAPAPPTLVGTIFARNITVAWQPPLENNAPIL
ncbi:hemicentin-1-like, partial [Sycon ciliatum]|uniref:hemicentin-1-like n=1 Tax=Sycon ciliatum TaxID=27933 RepID=UPI0031F64BFB